MTKMTRPLMIVGSLCLGLFGCAERSNEPSIAQFHQRLDEVGRG